MVAADSNRHGYNRHSYRPVYLFTAMAAVKGTVMATVALHRRSRDDYFSVPVRARRQLTSGPGSVIILLARRSNGCRMPACQIDITVSHRNDTEDNRRQDHYIYRQQPRTSAGSAQINPMRKEKQKQHYFSLYIF